MGEDDSLEVQWLLHSHLRADLRLRQHLISPGNLWKDGCHIGSRAVSRRLRDPKGWPKSLLPTGLFASRAQNV